MQTVFVGLSGGVDSAVSAALLKQHGYRVVGAFIKIWQPEFTQCTWREDRLDAMRVAAALEIPFREIDLSNQYKKEIVETMVADYARGSTPNPDVLCNKSIKFGYFARWADGQGAGLIATGHYARVENDTETFKLLRGIDREKDQSYFLYQLGQSELSKVLFPIGDKTKKQVRALARQFDLPVAYKRDSQGLCFVGDISLEEFLSRFLPTEEGMVLDMHGRVIGKHAGAPLYTIGQRHGFTVAGEYARDPQYVVRIDVAANALYVSSSREDAARERVPLRDAVWVHSQPKPDQRYHVQARYREESVYARITASKARAEVRFETPHIAVSGQSLVVYDGETCLGGGIIE